MIDNILTSYKKYFEKEIAVPFIIKVLKQNAPGNNIRKSEILCDGQQRIYFHGEEAFKHDSKTEGVKKFKR